MRKRGIVIGCVLLVLAMGASAQQVDSAFSSDAVDTSFLHQVNNDPTGYISGNEGVGTALQGFYTFPSQKQILMQMGGVDNLCVAIMFKKLHFGVTGFVGEGSNKPYAQAYCEAYAADNLGPGTVTTPSVIYYQEKFQAIGLFTTLPVKRFSADLRVVINHYSWYSPDAAFNFTQGGVTTYENMSGIHVVSWCISPGIGFRYLIYERFSVILNADILSNFNKGPHIFMLNATGGVAYEL